MNLYGSLIAAAFSRTGGPFGGEDDLSLLLSGPDIAGFETGCCGSRGGGGVDGLTALVLLLAVGTILTGAVVAVLLLPLTEFGKGCVKRAPRALLGPETKMK